MTGIFGNGTSLEPRELADLEVGDHVAECKRDGSYICMSQVTRKTARAIWIGTKSIHPRYNFDGDQINGHGICRVPTSADRQRHNSRAQQERKQKKENERRSQIRQQPEYQTGKNIGYQLQDADHCADEDVYLALMRLIGLKNLQVFEKLVLHAIAAMPKKPRKRKR